MEYLQYFTVFLLAGLCFGQTNNYRVCTEIAQSAACQAVQLGDSRVSCVIAETKVDCALKLASGQADFTILSEEEVLLVAQQQPDHHAVLASLRHQEKLNDTFAFESVAVVRATHTGGLAGLRGSAFCHPGYEINDQRWSPRVLEYFEDAVAQTSHNCDPEMRTPAGFQASALADFFDKACRPGRWTLDPTEDALLKSKFTSLCELCQNQNCADGHVRPAVNVQNMNSHQLALQCLDYGGNVSYVAWQHVRTFFQGRADVVNYGLLCEDGTTRALSQDIINNSNSPCSWVRQPWSAIVASKSVSNNLLTDLKSWFPSGRADTTSANWIRSLEQILFSDTAIKAVFNDSIPSPIDYVTPGRGSLSALDAAAAQGCTRNQRWCTISAAETLKCEWIRRAANSLGVKPGLECVQHDSEIACLNNIQMDRADFISLDSNYGYLARKRYKLSTVLYHQTQRANSSRVVALLKNSSTVQDAAAADNSSVIQRFENLRGKTACFPEYGGIAWVSFVRAAHERQVISESECNYGNAVAEFFGSACAPGAELASHTTSSVPVTLCGACRANPNYPSSGANSSMPVVTDPSAVVAPTVTADLVCGADYSNLYFSTNGTLACIASAHTDVAFIETQYLSGMFSAQGLNPDNFRVLCRNNTLAINTGISVDEACLLSYIVDGEILARKDWEQTIALKSLFFTLDELFGYSSGVNQFVGLKIYSPFNGVSDLLFRDSVIGLADSNSTSEQARNYEELFKHLDSTCSAAPATTPLPPAGSAARILLPILTMVLTPLLARVLN